MSDSVGDVASRLIAAYCEFSARVVASDKRFCLLALDASSVFRRLHSPLYIIVATYESIIAALAMDDIWFHEVLLDILPRTGERIELVPIVAGEPGDRRLARQLLETQRVGRECPIIPVEALVSRDSIAQPVDSLRAALLKYAPIHALSPYRIDTFAPPEMLFGREQVLADVRQSQSDKLLLTGARRIGKTSVAKAIQASAGEVQRWQSHFGASNDPISRCSFIDVRELGLRASTKQLWLEILHGFNLKPRDYAAGGRLVAVGRSTRRKMETSGQLFDESKALLSFIIQNQGELTIILDEVDTWIEQEAEIGWRTLDQLRAITDQGRAKVVLVGYESLLVAADNHRFPLFGRGIRSIRLGAIERPAMEELVSKPMHELGLSLVQEDQFFNRLWETTSGMPHLVQDICFHVVEGCLAGEKKQSRVGLQELERAIERSELLETFRLAVLNATDFPLAAAIAGICSLAGPGDLSWDETDDGSVDTKTITVGEIARRMEALSDGTYIYSHHDFRLALTYLELRFILRPLEKAKARWVWRNQIARKETAKALRNIGFHRWVKDMMALHHAGEWRKRYSMLSK